MNRRKFIVGAALCAAAGLWIGGAFASGAKRPVFVNYDDTHFFHSRDKLGIAVDETVVRSLVRQYRGTDVTDLLFCIGGRIADVPNKAKESWVDKYHQTVENGQPVCYTNSYAPRLAHEIYEVKKLDPCALWCEEARACGIHPWLSFRLNDCHDNFKPTSFLHPNFYHDHPDYRRIRHREPMGYFDRCLDFGIEAVRARELAFIREMLERYDADGIELDWQREIFCFVPGRECAETVGGFMRAARAICDAAAKRRGHPVKMMARVPADPDTALRFGFDVAAWADDGLVDVLVPCPRWDVTDNEIPVDLWKRFLRKTNVILAPGVELRMHDYGSKVWYETTEQLLGAAAAFYSQGADGFYLYNHFDDPDWKFHPGESHRCYFGDTPSTATMAVCWCNQEKWLKMIGTPEKVLAAPRDHMLTFRDIVPLWGSISPALPTEIAAGQQRYLRLVTGPVSDKSRLTLRIGIPGGVAPKSVFVNSRPCAYRETIDCPPPLSGDPFLCFDVPAYPERDALVEIVAGKSLRVTHLDLQVRAASDGAMSVAGLEGATVRQATIVEKRDVAPLIVNEPAERFFVGAAEHLELKTDGKRNEFADLWDFRFPQDVDLSERGVERYVDALAGGKLTHYFINLNYQRSFFPSKTIEPIWTSLDESGRQQQRFVRNLKAAFGRGLDVYAVMIRRCRERGVSPWLSFRMNDIHGTQLKTDPMVSAFWKEHPEWHIGRDDGWENGLDYAEKAVRDRMSAFIREALDRYDADGVELDFIRFPYYFRKGTERANAPILTAFLREIRAICDTAAKRRGHPVKIAARFLPNPAQAVAKGLDVDVWSKEGLLDMAIACNMYGSIEYEYHVDAWRKLLTDKTKFIAGTDNGIVVNGKRRILRLGEYRDWITKMRKDGADGFYFFNFTLRPYRDEAWRGVLGECIGAAARRRQ